MSSRFYKPRILKRALRQKGFKDVGQGKDHQIMALFEDEKQTPIRTRVSRGSGEIQAWVFAAIYKQLKMPDKSYLEEFLNCPITEEEYLRHLHEKGFLR